MSRGGARRGAGRPLGSRNRKTGEVAEMARTLGITPLEVMVEHMAYLLRGWGYGGRSRGG